MRIIKLSATASTNDYLLELLRKEQPKEPILAYTLNQTNGRGQQGNSWYGKSGESLAMSLFWPFPDGLFNRVPALNWLVSLTILETLKQIEGQDMTLKWPNDIMAGNSKLAGLLIESQLRGQGLRSTVIGLGINVNNLDFPESLPAVSLKQIDGRDHDPDALCLELGASLCAQLERLPDMDVDQLQRAYLNAQYGLGEWMEFEANGKRFEARIAGISQDGSLELLDTDGDTSVYQPKQLKYCF